MVFFIKVNLAGYTSGNQSVHFADVAPGAPGIHSHARSFPIQHHLRVAIFLHRRITHEDAIDHARLVIYALQWRKQPHHLS